MRWTHRTSIIAATVGLFGLVGASCTFLTSFNECAADADCLEKYGPRAICGEDRVCDVTTNVTTEQCQEVLGDLDADTFLIGVLLPLTGPEAGFGLPLLNAIKTGLKNFESLEVGGRNIALLVCDTEGVDDVALEAGRQAIEEARVTAIIGPDFSSQTIDIANEYAIPNNVLMVTPSGTAPQITTLVDNDLIWRTAPSDVAQASAIAQLVVEYVDQKLTTSPGETVIWVLYREGDDYGIGLQEALVNNLPTEITTSTNFKSEAYPANWEDTWFSEKAANLPAPDIALIMGAAESWDLAEAIDDTFMNDTVFVFADAARNPEEAALTKDTLQGRVLGTAPQNVGDRDYTPYTNFRLKYQSDHDEDPDNLQFVANAYDALHVVALAAAGGGGISGPELANGMSKLSSGTPVDANQSGASTGVQLLSQGETVDFQGASGRLDFDEHGDPSPSKIVLWCFLDGDVPEAGEILSTDGEFTFRDCNGAPPNNGTNNGADMGTPDMGTPAPDMGTPAPDMGMSTDMGAGTG